MGDLDCADYVRSWLSVSGMSSCVSEEIDAAGGAASYEYGIAGESLKGCCGGAD